FDGGASPGRTANHGERLKKLPRRTRSDGSGFKVAETGELVRQRCIHVFLPMLFPHTISASQGGPAMRTFFTNLFRNSTKVVSSQRRIRRRTRPHLERFQSRPILEALEDRRLLASDLSVTKTGPTG